MTHSEWATPVRYSNLQVPAVGSGGREWVTVGRRGYSARGEGVPRCLEPQRWRVEFGGRACGESSVRARGRGRRQGIVERTAGRHACVETWRAVYNVGRSNPRLEIVGGEDIGGMRRKKCGIGRIFYDCTRVSGRARKRVRACARSCQSMRLSDAPRIAGS
jgi:hypothetical protein